jgi:hypothetical protein
MVLSTLLEPATGIEKIKTPSFEGRKEGRKGRG